MEKESRMVAVGSCGQEGMGSYCLMSRVSVLQDEQSFEDDGGNGCTTMSVYLMPLNCAF